MLAFCNLKLLLFKWYQRAIYRWGGSLMSWASSMTVVSEEIAVVRHKIWKRKVYLIKWSSQNVLPLFSDIGAERTMMIWVLGTWLRDSWSYSRCKGVEFELKQLIKWLDRYQTVETLCWQNWEIVLWSFSDHSLSSWMKSHVIKRAVDSCLAAVELQSMKIEQLCRTIHLYLLVHKVFVLVRLYGRMSNSLSLFP